MIFVGFGLGKIRVIIYRIVNMVVNKNIVLIRILVISFIKVFLIEMKNRVLNLSDDIRFNKVIYGIFYFVFFKILRYFERYNLDSIFDEKLK